MRTESNVFRDYFDAVAEELHRSQYHSDTAASILADLESQIEERLHGRTLTPELEDEILSELSPPDSYRTRQPSPEPQIIPEATPKPTLRRNVLLIAAGGLVLACIVVASILINLQRNLANSSAAVDEAEAQVENMLQRRYDLIPNLVATVKANAEYESETLTKLTELRMKWAEAKDSGEKSEINQQLSPLLLKVMERGHTLPELRANQAFRDLMISIEGSENRLSIERRRYNIVLSQYNASLRKFPDSLLASSMGLAPRTEYFQAASDAKVAPRVEF